MKRQFVKAASTAKMINAFEAKLAEMKGNDIESATDITCGYAMHTGRDENEWYIDTNGQFTGHPGDLVSKADLIDYWNENLGSDPTLEGNLEGWLYHTLEFMEPADIDASTDEVDDELDPVKGHDSWNEDNVYMLMDYTGGTEGPESDTFDCYGKFFAKDEADANDQLENVKSADPDRMKFIDNAYVEKYNDYFDDGDEVYPDLATLVNSTWIAPNDYDGNVYDDELPFASTSTEGDNITASELIMDGEEVAEPLEEDVECSDDLFTDIEQDVAQDAEEEPIEAGLFDDDYFGKEQAAKYGDLIASNLSGQTVSKRRDLAEEPGGLIYEANLLGIDMWDLLEALEGMCYQGRAVEIDDSTYRVK